MQFYLSDDDYDYRGSSLMILLHKIKMTSTNASQSGTTLTANRLPARGLGCHLGTDWGPKSATDLYNAMKLPH